ncbi:MAG TPA: hypothetical protein IGS52_13380 [Oscillatoriaceae cyanobacterium M33_DOE_052]|uniref:Uncharacterized protein n=1 Tax=Planktothricoides sp. SpSt-374 TaxID=2282167 RepID=A0A7C3ZKP4_9CYAN|nr:hypothetical protein [Oscillatoriaceae cyanobacterium M33_DOE_052]
MFFAIDSTSTRFCHLIMDALREVSPPSGEWWWVFGCSNLHSGAIATRTPSSVPLASPLPPPAAGVGALPTPSNSSLWRFPGTK